MAFTGIGGNSGEDGPDVGVGELEGLGSDLGGHGENVVPGTRRRVVFVGNRVWVCRRAGT